MKNSNNFDMEKEKNSIVKTEKSDMIEQNPLDYIKNNVDLVNKLYKQLMKKDVDYGVVPGTSKPTLLKAGAEKITFMFRLAPFFDVKKEWLTNGHLNVDVLCTIKNQNGDIIGQGVGSCSTLEKKYRYREAERVCPNCGKPTLIKGKEEYGGGWVCYVKKGGCGAKFAADDANITNQKVGKVENSDIADVYNTVLKMAKKRAYIDATLTVAGVSDLFTQDAEDFAKKEIVKEQVKEQPEETKKEEQPVEQKKEQENQQSNADEEEKDKNKAWLVIYNRVKKEVGDLWDLHISKKLITDTSIEMQESFLIDIFNRVGSYDLSLKTRLKQLKEQELFAVLEVVRIIRKEIEEKQKQEE